MALIPDLKGLEDKLQTLNGTLENLIAVMSGLSENVEIIRARVEDIDNRLRK